ncbi:hypothetical protein [Parafilimonas sp.]|uniref:hypothetical protein n=1 Tax=Parafilimonas sp. TaxID=1969739 RepID=UPI003F7DF067
MGEAANRVSEPLKEKYPDMNGIRYVVSVTALCMNYIDIDYEIVWQIKETYLNELLNQLKKITAE